MKTISRYIMTLALLLTAVTGAWAEEKSETISTNTSQAEYTGEHFKITPNREYYMLAVADLRYYADGQVYFSVETLDGQNISKLDLQINDIDDTSIDNLSLSSGTKSYDSNTKVLTITNVNAATVQITLTEGDQYGEVTISSVTYYYEESSAVTVAWNASTKTGTFAMPGSDVVLTPIYAKAAAFATTGTEPEVKLLAPAAAEGVIAGTDASLIAEGTGIVAFAGESTEATQGTLMYAIGTSATEAPAPAAFSATVPTAKTVADDGADVLVWYYIQGADAPEGEAATLDNTFSDTEPACLTVQVLSNKFDIQLNAANANTIEAGKATVTVGGAAATVTDGKLQGVKMGSEVKLEAKPGYKFRKVEVKKKGAGPLAAAFKDGAKIKVGYKWNTYNTTYLEFTNSGGTYSLTSVSGDNDGNGFNSSTLTAKDGNVLALDVVCNPGGWSKMDEFSAQIEFDATSSTYKYSSKGANFDGIISVSVNDTDITSQLTEAK